MANELSQAAPPQTLQGIARLPIVQQLGLLIGIAASVALGVAVVMWSQTPSFSQLYAGLSDKDVGLVLDGLRKSNTPHKIAPGGVIMVPSEQVHETRIKLAAQGLPKGSDAGLEMLQEQRGFGVSQFMEVARYQHALEGELARSIGALANVESARVHLAIPKQSAFVRNRQPASASVLLNLFAGRSLEEDQVAAIIHLVASSVPNLETSRVTVVDQRGRLLSSANQQRDGLLNAHQFDYTRRLEESYIKRIEEILSPITGRGAVRAQVVAELDFTVTEQTQEKFNPEQPALRSEQVMNEQSAGAAGTQGIPGALSNQPPGAGSVPETTAKPPAGKGEANKIAAESTGPYNSSNRATRNYELDKTISHTRQPSGTLKRLAVAIVVDDRLTVNADGEVQRTPLTPEELERITNLAKEAVGFNAQRGDSLNVLNASFQEPPKAEPLPEPPIWKQAWVWDVGKQVLGGLVVLFLIFGVIRPVTRGLLNRHLTTNSAPMPNAQAALPAGAYAAAGGALPGPAGVPMQVQLAAPSTADYDAQVNLARQLTAQDPKRVAQVVKNWVSNDA